MGQAEQRECSRTCDPLTGWSLLAARCPPRVAKQVVSNPDFQPRRHILNVNTIMRALRSRYSPQHVAVQLAYMEVGGWQAGEVGARLLLHLGQGR